MVRNSGVGVFLDLCENRGGEEPIDAATVQGEDLKRLGSRETHNMNPEGKLLHDMGLIV